MLAEQVRRVVHKTVRTPVAIKRGVQTTPTLCPNLLYYNYYIYELRRNYMIINKKNSKDLKIYIKTLKMSYKSSCH